MYLNLLISNQQYSLIPMELDEFFYVLAGELWFLLIYYSLNMQVILNESLTINFFIWVFIFNEHSILKLLILLLEALLE